jgi:soluble lytic murein transglycosylase-like protein
MPTILPLFALFLACALAAPVARADCIDDAAARHQVNALVLRAIGWQESRLRPTALRRNVNGSVDVGAFQINSVHFAELARLGVPRAALADGCTSAEAAAWHYRRQVEIQGNGWGAVGAYHSHTSARAAAYANRIAAILMRWKAMPPGPLPFPQPHTPAPARSPDSPSASPLSPPSPESGDAVGVIAWRPSVR